MNLTKLLQEHMYALLHSPKQNLLVKLLYIQDTTLQIFSMQLSPTSVRQRPEELLPAEQLLRGHVPISLRLLPSSWDAPSRLLFPAEWPGDRDGRRERRQTGRAATAVEQSEQYATEWRR